MVFRSINPATGKLLCENESLNEQAVNMCIEGSHRAFRLWKDFSFAKRAQCFEKLATLLLESKEDIARLLANEMGKPISQGRSEIEKSASACSYYAQKTELFLKDEYFNLGYTESFVTYQPLGVVLGIMPWNFPFWQTLRAAAPILMAGNTILIKPAPNVSACALVLQQLFKYAGFPENVMSNLFIDTSLVEHVIANPLVKAVTMTSSTLAGKAVALICGKHMKKCLMELGGNDPYIILEDADLSHAARTCVQSRMINNGQSCIAAKRFIVVQSVAKEFEAHVVDEISKYKVGDPLKESTTLGPLARIDLKEKLHSQVQDSIAKGATLVLGGDIRGLQEAYYPPTLLKNIKKGMPAYDEELFGPVVSLIIVQNEEEAIEVANDSIFGLGGAIFTQNIERGKKIAREKIQTGMCFINDFVKSDPRAPFGGINDSGYGRELGPFGAREFVNIKTVAIR